MEDEGGEDGGHSLQEQEEASPLAFGARRGMGDVRCMAGKGQRGTRLHGCGESKAVFVRVRVRVHVRVVRVCVQKKRQFGLRVGMCAGCQKTVSRSSLNISMHVHV